MKAALVFYTTKLYYGRLSYPALKANRHKSPISIYICENVETEAPFTRFRIFLKPHEISESLVRPRPICKKKNYNAFQKYPDHVDRRVPRLTRTLRADKQTRQKQKQKDKTHIWLD